MKFIDLEDGHPNHPGIYTVKIKESTGGVRECKASWSARGFLPIADALGPEEYIFAWAELH
tara:strand:- start:579 stop:761 length:183 start_codon:yes stop_codon:yes gene_type:complete